MKKLLLFTGLAIVSAAGTLLSLQDSKGTFTKYHAINPAPNFSVDAPPGKTGAPFEGHCNDCHGGSINPAEGTISLTGLGLAGFYLPGETYDANIAAGLGLRNGFSLIIVNEDEDSEGTFTPGEGTSVWPMDTRDYLTQQDKFKTDYDFQWTALATEAGDLTVCYSYRVIYDDDWENDELYLGEALLKSGTASIEKQDVLKESYQISYDVFSQEAKLKFELPQAEKVVIHVQTLSGQKVLAMDLGLLEAGAHQERLLLTDSEAHGIYLVSILVGNRFVSKQLYL